MSRKTLSLFTLSILSIITSSCTADLNEDKIKQQINKEKTKPDTSIGSIEFNNKKINLMNGQLLVAAKGGRIQVLEVEHDGKKIPVTQWVIIAEELNSSATATNTKGTEIYYVFYVPLANGNLAGPNGTNHINFNTHSLFINNEDIKIDKNTKTEVTFKSIAAQDATVNFEAKTIINNITYSTKLKFETGSLSPTNVIE